MLGIIGGRETDMCSRVTCHSCGKASWSGCGLHVEEALAGVPAAERCHCDD